ncbi:hypothetical protein LJC34_05015 [Oscillospiraceae bacterium OttesenSCG-928-G22]|nr:hypothetical protein [Oscillospiraceae bacterium OttesenSCG-928-G22]
MEEKINLIFLDIDGVVYLDESIGAFSESALVCLKDLVMKANAYIVISSSWRVHKEGSEKHALLTNAFKRHDILDSIIGKTGFDPLRTHELNGADFGQGQGKVRCKNIYLWLLDHREQYNIRAFVILDDLNQMGILEPYLATCDPSTGLTEAVANKALSILSSPVDVDSILC